MGEGDTARGAGRRLRSRLPAALVAVGGAVVVTLALTGAGSPGAGLSFSPAGHWVANAAAGEVVHVNGAGRTVDATAAVPDLSPGSPVAQGDSSAYVVGPSRITEFGKSDLAVTGGIPAPVTGERPVVFEVDGGPYLVYRDAGTVVRLGPTMTVVPAGGPLGEPVAARDGRVWVHRTGDGAICDLGKGADRLACPAATPAGHSGGLTLLGEKPIYVDTTARTFSLVGLVGLEQPVDLGIDVSPSARVAGSDTAGRIAVFDPVTSRLHLVDTAGLTRDRPAAPPVTVAVPPGDYATPATTGDSVALLDRHSRTLRTYGADGSGRSVRAIPPEPGEARISRGQDDRLYVDGDSGKHVVVVDPDGSVGDVAVGDDPGADRPVAPVPPPVTPPPSQDPKPSAGRPDPASPPKTAVPPPTPTRRPAPPPVTAQPATPPGVPPGLRATVSGSGARVQWSAAAANGAAVTAYHVSWSLANGSGAGSLDAAGTARTATIPTLTAGATYTVRVVAENGAGRGAAASTTVTRAAPKPAIALSQGARPTEDENRNCGEDRDIPDCGWMHIRMTGFAPNTTYLLMPHSSDPGYSNKGVRRKTDASGALTADAFYYYGVGRQVWVTVDDVKSTTITWKAAS
ncbi:fibronectin type III domain-containing protein [Amycolatopsis sp. NPDC051758]|uniref:fibronectin type III domain-containing protein n=1 Tax=Amycolatopsis sp. NPDC051758 TaxID=3363935 RepID=UPI0037AA09B9